MGVIENINNFYFLGIKLEFRDLAFMPQLLQISDVELMFHPIPAKPGLVLHAASNIKIIQ